MKIIVCKCTETFEIRIKSTIVTDAININYTQSNYSDNNNNNNNNVSHNTAFFLCVGPSVS